MTHTIDVLKREMEEGRLIGGEASPTMELGRAIGTQCSDAGKLPESMNGDQVYQVVNGFLERHPDATFDELKAHCLRIYKP